MESNDVFLQSHNKEALNEIAVDHVLFYGNVAWWCAF